MAFDVSRFRSAFNGSTKNDLMIASPAYFEVQIIGLPPKVLEILSKKPRQKSLANEMEKNLRFRCMSTDLPSRQTVGLSRQLFGPMRILPYATNYSTTMLDFYETPNFNVRAMFDAWIDLIEGNHQGYMSEYYDDLVAQEFEIIMFNKSGDRVARWRLYDAYPISVNSSMLNWETQDSHISIPVEISYHKWTSDWEFDVEKRESSKQSSSAPEYKPEKHQAQTYVIDEPATNNASNKEIYRNKYGEPYIFDGELDKKNTKVLNNDLSNYDSKTVDNMKTINKL